jgi:hypothetical protein
MELISSAEVDATDAIDAAVGCRTVASTTILEKQWTLLLQNP